MKTNIPVLRTIIMAAILCFAVLTSNLESNRAGIAIVPGFSPRVGVEPAILGLQFRV